MKTVMITGSTDGIGKYLAHRLLEQNYRVIIHGRSKEKVDKTKEELLRKLGKNKILAQVADLFDFSQVQEMCNNLINNKVQIDVILHNAGTYENSLIFNNDHIEKTFAVNFVSNVLINELLIPFLTSYFKFTNDEPLRIIYVSSIAYGSGRFDLKEWFVPHHFNGYQAYANSKMAQIMYTYYCAEIYKENPLVFHSLHPGVIDTKILRENFKMKGSSLEEGIKTPYFLITSEEAKKSNGKYWNNKKIEKTKSETTNTEYQKLLYDETIKYIKKYL